MPDPSIRELVYGHEQAFLPEKAVGINTVIQYRLTGPEAGDYIITIQDAKCKVTEGIAPNAKMTLSADANDFRNIILGRMDPTMAFMQGKLKLLGDFTLAMKLTSLFKMK